jgi:hypothetical protein
MKSFQSTGHPSIATQATIQKEHNIFNQFSSLLRPTQPNVAIGLITIHSSFLRHFNNLTHFATNFRLPNFP